MAADPHNEVILSIISADNHFMVLGLPITEVSCDIVKRQYYKLALKVHPDKNLSNQDAVEAFKRISIAYEQLGQTTSQMRYLISLNAKKKDSKDESQDSRSKKKTPKRETEPKHYKAKSYEEFVREWEQMQYLFNAENEEEQNKKRARDIARLDARQEKDMEVSIKSAAIVEALSEGADNRASDWKNFQKKKKKRK